MTHAQELTKLYRQFYRHSRAGKLNSNKILRPVTEASKAILNADPRVFYNRESVVEVVHATIRSFMKRIENDSALGRSPKWIEESIRESAKEEFAEHFAGIIFWDVMNHDTAALRGRQLNLLKNACELVYMNEENREYREFRSAQEKK